MAQVCLPVLVKRSTWYCWLMQASAPPKLSARVLALHSGIPREPLTAIAPAPPAPVDPVAPLAAAVFPLATTGVGLSEVDVLGPLGAPAATVCELGPPVFLALGDWLPQPTTATAASTPAP